MASDKEKTYIAYYRSFSGFFSFKVSCRAPAWSGPDSLYCQREAGWCRGSCWGFLVVVSTGLYESLLLLYTVAAQWLFNSPHPSSTSAPASGKVSIRSSNDSVCVSACVWDNMSLGMCLILLTPITSVHILIIYYFISKPFPSDCVGGGNITTTSIWKKRKTLVQAYWLIKESYTDQFRLWNPVTGKSALMSVTHTFSAPTEGAGMERCRV